MTLHDDILTDLANAQSALASAQTAVADAIALMDNCACGDTMGGGGSDPSWLLTLNGNNPHYQASFDTGHYYASGTEQASLAAFMTATGYAHPATPRFDANGALYLEDQLVKNMWPSNDFTSSRWAKTELTVASGFTAADGVTPIYKITESSGYGTYGFHQLACNTLTVTTNSYGAASIFMKKGTCTKARLWVVHSSPGYYVDVDLNDGTYTAAVSGTGSLLKADVKNRGNDEYEVMVSGIATGYSDVNFCVMMRNASGAVQYTGNGTNYMYVWKAQFGNEDCVLSYEPTTTAAVTRSQDSLIRTVTSPTAITKVFKARTAKLPPPEYATLYHLDNNSNNSAYADLEVFRLPDKHVWVRVTYQLNTHYELDMGIIANDTEFKLAFTASASGLIASINGATALSTSVGNWPTDFVRERLGTQVNDFRRWNGTVALDATFLDTATASQLQVLSA